MADLTEKQAKREGATVHFGLGQLNNPTPMAARWAFRIFLALTAFWALAAPNITEIPEATLSTINRWLVVANFGVNQLIKLFGWDFSGDR